MEFKHIEYFIETCHHKSMSKAADALYISQQALSRCITNMEAELGCTLFQRTVKGITLTEDGTYFYDIFAPQVEQFQKSLADTIAHFENKPVSLPFCCAPLIFRCLDPDLLFSFQEKYPPITLELLELSDTECDAYVEADVSHFGLLAIPENRHGERLSYKPVKTFPLYLFVHKDNPLAALKKVNFSKLRTEPFLMLDKKSYYRKLVWHYARKYQFEPKTVFESSDANQLISLVNKGRGIALSLAPMLDRSVYENVVMVPFDDETITWCIAFIYQDYEKLSSVAKKFIRFLIEQVNTISPPA